MTESHGKRRGDLADNVDRREERHGVRKTFKVMNRAAFKLIISYKEKYKYRPPRRNVKV